MEERIRCRSTFVGDVADAGDSDAVSMCRVVCRCRPFIDSEKKQKPCALWPCSRRPTQHDDGLTAQDRVNGAEPRHRYAGQSGRPCRRKWQDVRLRRRFRPEVRAASTVYDVKGFRILGHPSHDKAPHGAAQLFAASSIHADGAAHRQLVLGGLQRSARTLHRCATRCSAAADVACDALQQTWPDRPLAPRLPRRRPMVAAACAMHHAAP